MNFLEKIKRVYFTPIGCDIDIYYKQRLIMRRKNEVLDRISSIELELGRLKDQIPTDTDPRFEMWLRMIVGVEKQLEYLQNLVELEDED